MSAFTNILDGCVAAQVRLREERAQQISTDWRMIERALIEYFRAQRAQIADGGGTQFVEVVRFNGPDDFEASWISLEDLARRLADEVSR